MGLRHLIESMGVLPEGTIAEQRRWCPDDVQSEEVGELTTKLKILTPEQIRAELARLVDELGYVAIRKTDLDAYAAFARHPKEGELVMYDERARAKRSKVTYARHSAGYLIHVHGLTQSVVDSMLYVMTDGKSHLCIEEDTQVYFGEGSEVVYLGDAPEFLYLKPASVEQSK